VIKEFSKKILILSLLEFSKFKNFSHQGIKAQSLDVRHNRLLKKIISS